MRRFLFNTTVLSSVVGVWSVIQATRRGPRDWRLIAMWVSWALTVAVAIGTVVKESQTGHELED